MNVMKKRSILEFSHELLAYCEQDDFTTLEGFYDTLAETAFSDWRDYIQFNDETYQRNIIVKNEKFELTLICWRSGHHTDLHDHPANGCLIRILQGELFEKRRCPKEQETSSTLKAGQTVYMCNELGYHQITNQSGSDTISLHMYSPGM